MSTEIGSHKRKTMDSTEDHFRQLPLSIDPINLPSPPPSPKPPFILRLKDEYVAPEHEELVRLTLATGSTYQPPPKKAPLPPPPESPPHPSLLQLMPPSSFAPSRRSQQPPPESQLHPSFLQLHSFRSYSRSPEPPESQLQSSLLLPSSSSRYIEPPPGFHFSMPSSSRQFHIENASALKSPAKLSPPEQPEQRSRPPAELAQAPEGQAHRSGARRARNYKKPGWKATIEPPYPWASNTRAKVLSMQELISKDIIVISGDVYCKECKKQFQIRYDLRSKFSQVVSFIEDEENEEMHDRAPKVWLKPEDLDCNLCDKSKCVQPVISLKKRNTNWLFLFLGQMIGYCNLTHLRYFCKHNKHHRTAAKDRLVYLAYTTLHSQLDPEASDRYNK